MHLHIYTLNRDFDLKLKCKMNEFASITITDTLYVFNNRKEDAIHIGVKGGFFTANIN